MNQEQTNITTGKQIRHLRTQLGMTQEELAGELNVTRQALSNWERDVNEPDLNMLKKICFLFKDIRVIFILGAGSLRTGIDNHLVVEDIKKLTGSE
ncbi:helix-turn-helix transcriptional regulator, partial [Lactobacillus johnsonii]